MRSSKNWSGDSAKPPDERHKVAQNGPSSRQCGRSKRGVGRCSAVIARVVGVLAAALVASSGVAAAHTDYVVSHREAPHNTFRFLIGVLADPSTALLLAGGGLLAVTTVAWHRRGGTIEQDLAVLRRTLDGYGPLVPWILRLGVGLPLVGAGVVRHFFSPLVPLSAVPAPPAATRLFLLGAGFALLIGLATRVVAAVVLAVYAVAVGFVSADLLLAVEYTGALAALVLLGSGRPSADHLVERVTNEPGTAACRLDPMCDLRERVVAALAPYRSYAVTAMRTALGLTLVHLGLVNKLLAPGEALAVVAKYNLAQAVPISPGLWVIGAGFTEVTIGTALVLGLYTRFAAAVTFSVLTLTMFGLPDDPVLAHVSLFAVSAALVVTGGGPLALDRWGSKALPETDFVDRGGRPRLDD